MNVWVNGCFDILHVGHIKLLEYAKYYKDSDYIKGETNILYVGIDSDKRVKELKGGSRPINNEKDRKKILQSLKFVDKVFIYDTEEELTSLIEKWQIDVIIIGEDYKDKRVVGREKSKYDVVFFPKDKNSSTNIIEKIKKL